MSVSDGLLKLRWNNHEATFCHILHRLRSKPRYADATLACEGRLFMVHRLVLATCSDFFDEIFQNTPSDSSRAVIVLNEARAQDVECLLDYMYCGQVNVRQANLGSLLRTAESLKIKGLAASETTVASTNKRTPDPPSPPESPPPKKKRKKKDKNTPQNPLSPATSLPTPVQWNKETPKLSSLLNAPQSAPHSAPQVSSPLYTSAPTSLGQPQSHLNLPLVPVKTCTMGLDKGKSGWLQIVSSMRQSPAAAAEGTPHQQFVKQTLMQVVKNKSSKTHDSEKNRGQKTHDPEKNRGQKTHDSEINRGQKSLDYDAHPSQFLQTEIKEEVKDEPVSSEDLSCGDEDAWGEDAATPELGMTPERPRGYRKVPPLYATSTPPPPGLHPVVSGGTSGITTPGLVTSGLVTSGLTTSGLTTSGLTPSAPPHALPIGLFRVGSFAVQSAGQSWESSQKIQTSRKSGHQPHQSESSAQDSGCGTPSASQTQPLDLGINHLIGLNKKGSASQSTMSPKMMPYATCSNCYTNNTKLWRRNEKGEIVCNACGLYFKLHGVNRPSHLFRLAPMTRRRNPKKKKESNSGINVTTSAMNPTDLMDTTSINDSCVDKEGVCESDPAGEGLAVLNAALTLNFLANAKAHHHQQSEALAAQQQQQQNTGSIPKTGSEGETRPPPPLLKIPIQPDIQHDDDDQPPDQPEPPPTPDPPQPTPTPTPNPDEGRKIIAQLLDK